MAMRVRLRQQNIDRLVLEPLVVRDLTDRVAAIADACNEQSSWGGYDYEVEIGLNGPVGRVWSFDEAADEARAQRLLRNLDAAR